MRLSKVMRDKSTGTHRVLFCTAAANNVLRHDALFGGIRGEFLERDTTHFPRRGAARGGLRALRHLGRHLLVGAAGVGQRVLQLEAALGERLLAR